MNTKDHALDLALEALEETLKTLDDANASPGGPIADTIWYSPHETLFDYLEAQITAIKQVLAKDALYKLAEESCTSGLRLDDWDKVGCVNHDCDKCKAVQEPVAYLVYDKGAHSQYLAFEEELGDMDDCEVEPLYTTPPAAQRQWVGLTDEEIEPYYAANKPLIKWVEAKLKEKNT